MTELDEELLPVAAELIDEFGADILYGTIIPGAYSPATGLAAPVGVLPGVKAIIASGQTRTRSGGLVEGATLALIIAAINLPAEPTPEDRAEVNGTPYKVTMAEPTYTGQMIAIYTIWLTR